MFIHELCYITLCKEDKFMLYTLIAKALKLNLYLFDKHTYIHKCMRGIETWNFSYTLWGNFFLPRTLLASTQRLLTHPDVV